MKKKITITLIILVLVIAGTYLIAQKSKANAHIQNTAVRFTQLLIEGKTQEALQISTGTVKYNLATSIPQDKSYQYIEADAQIEVATPELAIVHVAATYKSTNAINVSFSKIHLIKQEGLYKVYFIEEENPPIPNGRIKQVEVNDFFFVFQSYLTGIEKQDYTSASKALIGKAKKAHDSISSFLRNTQLIKNISELHGEVILAKDKQAVVNFTYIVDDRTTSSLVYFYKTIEGWKIYEVIQL